MKKKLKKKGCVPFNKQTLTGVYQKDSLIKVHPKSKVGVIEKGSWRLGKQKAAFKENETLSQSIQKPGELTGG